MRHSLARTLGTLLVGTHLCGGQAAAQRQPHDALRAHADFTDAELLRLEQGEVVAKVLETADSTEVAVAGAVWIEGRMEDYVAWQRDIESFETGDAVLGIGTISRPPTLSDFESLTLPREDFEDLEGCRVGDCSVKISDAGLERLQNSVDWDAPDAYEQANLIARQLLLERVQRYLEGGDEALGAYQDQKRPTFVDEEFDTLLANSPYVIEYHPELHAYLDEFPQAELSDAEEFVYWSTVTFGLKPVIRMTHVVIYPVPDSPSTEYVIGAKMLYASHYFHTGLELRYLSRDTGRPDADGFYLISVNRSRSDGLTGLFGGIVRWRAEAGARDGLAQALENAKAILESRARVGE